MLQTDFDWEDVLPKRRSLGMDVLRGDRHTVVLRPSRKVLYLSAKVVANLIQPEFVGVKKKKDSQMVGLFTATKATGYKVKYDPVSKTACITIKAFADTYPDWEPGTYECIRETVRRKDSPANESYVLVVFSMDKKI